MKKYQSKGNSTIYSYGLGMKHFILMIFSMILASSVSASQSIPKLELDKIKVSEILTGPYSYFIPPYSYYYLHNMDKLGYRVDWIRRSGPVYPLQDAHAPFTTTYTYKQHTYTLEQYFKRNAVLSFLVLKDNQILAEYYFHGSDANSRFLSNSVGKSITSTLFGVALEEGKIASVDDPVTKYLPVLSSSGFSRVTLKQALQMATGIALSKNAQDPYSSEHALNASVLRGKPSFLDYIKTLKADPKVKPGTVFDYQNVNTEVLGLAIETATGMPFNEYLQAKIWSKIGAQSDAYLYRAKEQTDQCAFGCFSATLRDYGRFGLMMMNGGTLDGTHVVSDSWIKQATRPEPSAPQPKDDDQGYGYQWWISAGKDGAYEGHGIFGQILYVNPTKHIIIVILSAWPQPDPGERWDESTEVINAIVAKIASEK